MRTGPVLNKGSLEEPRVAAFSVRHCLSLAGRLPGGDGGSPQPGVGERLPVGSATEAAPRASELLLAAS